jgi:uncharacterized membrane protein YedE/YeeE
MNTNIHLESLLSPFLGGALIGLAAALLLLLLGRIAGISGILSTLIEEFPSGAEKSYLSYFKENAWRYTFVLGLLLGGAILRYFFAAEFDFDYTFAFSRGWYAISGLLVGFGTGLGGGCTSGHGVCGIGRFSVRSVVATMIFMATGILTVTAVRLISTWSLR